MNPEFDDLIREGISDLVIDSLDKYWNYGYEPGSFLRAVLCNDLADAVVRADPWNKKNLAKIVEYVMTAAPFGSWGSAEAYNDWIKKGHYYEANQKKRVVDILRTP